MSLRVGAVLAAWVATALACSAQTPIPSLQVYSEFQRIDPFGNVVPADRARLEDVRPREILSPGVAGNAHASYHVAVTAPEGMPFTLFVGQYPPDFLGLTVYREVYTKLGSQWVPDGVERVTLPFAGQLPDTSRPIPGQTTVTFLMDIQVPVGAGGIRTKLEPQLKLDNRWITYPMEMRILGATLPEHKDGAGTLAGIEEPADSTARRALESYLCGSTAIGSPAPNALRWFTLRNALEDIVLARSLEPRPGATVLPEILRLAGSRDPAKWCQAPVFPNDLGAEWYLRFRDALYRMAM
jgi:hypothetical protein